MLRPLADRVTFGQVAVTIPTESLPPARAAVPITERVLPHGRLRWLVIAAWSAVPLARLGIFASLIAGAGLIAAPMDFVEIHFAGALLNTYVLLIVLLGIRPVTNRLVEVAALGNERTQRVARLNGSTLGPLLLLLVFVVLGEISTLIEFGGQAVAGAPVPFIVEFVFALLIRLPQAVALWTSVVALATIAELGRQPVPGSFPEDRSLGLRKSRHLAHDDPALLRLGPRPSIHLRHGAGGGLPDRGRDHAAWTGRDAGRGLANPPADGRRARPRGGSGNAAVRVGLSPRCQRLSGDRRLGIANCPVAARWRQVDSRVAVR